MISVVIPNLNSPVIGQVLAAVRAQADACPDPLEVWVVGQDVHSQAHSDEQLHFLETPHPVPPSLARNMGAALAQGETLIFLDADCVPQPGWLAALLEAKVRWPEAGAISGAMLPDGDTFAAHCGQIASFHEHLNLNQSGQRRLLASFSLLVNRSVWNVVGGFDPDLRIAEDVDLSIRLAQLGRLLYLEPQAQVFHQHQRNDWQALWQHALFGGQLSIHVRRRYAEWFKMPAWSVYPWMWRLLSPFIAIASTMNIYAKTPGLHRYWHCIPWVLASKFAWCWGAAKGLTHTSTSIEPSEPAQSHSIAQEYYDRRYRLGKSPPSLDRVRSNLEGMRIDCGDRILDVGCGVGTTGAFLASRGALPFGIDISLEAARIASKLKDYAAILQASAESLPLADASFDGATFMGTLEHFYDPVAALHEAHRLLKPGAQVCFVVPNSEFFLFRAFGGTGQPHEVPRSLEGWRQLFENTGFRVETAYRDIGPGIFEGGVIRGALRKLTLIFFNWLPLRYTYQFVFICHT